MTSGKRRAVAEETMTSLSSDLSYPDPVTIPDPGQFTHLFHASHVCVCIKSFVIIPSEDGYVYSYLFGGKVKKCCIVKSESFLYHESFYTMRSTK